MTGSCPPIPGQLPGLYGDPVDTHRLCRAVSDDVWDHFDLNDTPNADWFIENVEVPLLALVCHYEGHIVVDDMCMRPEHRYCARCSQALPNAAVTPYPPSEAPVSPVTARNDGVWPEDPSGPTAGLQEAPGGS